MLHSVFHVYSFTLSYTDTPDPHKHIWLTHTHLIHTYTSDQHKHTWTPHTTWSPPPPPPPPPTDIHTEPTTIPLCWWWCHQRQSSWVVNVPLPRLGQHPCLCPPVDQCPHCATHLSHLSWANTNVINMSTCRPVPAPRRSPVMNIQQCYKHVPL